MIDYPNNKKFTLENESYPHERCTAVIQFSNNSVENSIFESDLPSTVGAHIDRFYFFKPFCLDKNILDIGCGFRYGSKILSSVAKSIHAIDLDSNEIEYAKLNHSMSNIIFENISLHKLNSIYDVVICTEVIEHLPLDEVAPFILKASTLLNPNGIAIFTTPTQLKTQKTDNYYHIIEYSHKDFVKLLSKKFNCISGFFYDWTNSTISMKPAYQNDPGKQSLMVQIIICTKKLDVNLKM